MDPLPAPPAVGPDATVAYGPDPDQVVDLYRAAAERASVALIHGGFWKPAYDRDHLRAMADTLRSAGFSVALLEYRRTPTDRWAALSADVRAGLRTALDHLPGPVVVAGHSAGGHLAVWAGALPEFAGRFERVVSLAGVLDLRAADALGLGAGAVRGLLGDPHDHAEQWAEADPLRRPPLTPVRLVHGVDDQDVPVDQSRAYARAWAGEPVDLIEVADCDHWPLITPGTAPFGVVVDQLEQVDQVEQPGRD